MLYSAHMHVPDKDILRKYAQVMVRYGLGKGKGVQPGETVYLAGHECSKPLFMEIYDEIHRAGGHVIPQFMPNEFQRYGLSRSKLELANDEQLEFFPHAYWRGVTDAMDHLLFVLSYHDIHALAGVPSERIAKANASMAPFMEMRKEKEAQGKLSWTLCLYGTASAAKEAGLTEEEYWEEIINACHLRDEDPVARWREVDAAINQIRQKLDALKIETLRIEGVDADLMLRIGEHRRWLGGGGANIPSYEIFTSPDWRGTEGWIRFDQPLYYSGKRISGIYLRFENGVVVEAAADENEDALKHMIANENADKVGEFSLTEGTMSKIGRFMANTLYDENRGGRYGNTHIALGQSFKDAFVGDMAKPTPDEWEAMGFNQCPKVHTDIISTADRTVTATLADGSTKVIYQDGAFTL